MSSQPVPRLSVCMIAKNEAAVLGRCLDSIKPAADEIIVVDTGSVDDTLHVAELHGARVIPSEWRDDFSYSRNLSIEEAQCPWILWLDADDIVPAESIPLINSLKQENPNKVFGMIVRNQKPNGTGTEFVQARMFPNLRSIRFERSIHEQIMPSALRLGMKMVITEVVIEHHGYADPEDMKIKATRNVTLLLKEVDKNNPDPVLFVEIADSYAIMGDQENAKVWYEKVVNIPACRTQFPVVASQAYMGLGNGANRSEDYARAIDCFTRAKELCPERTDVLYCLAVSLELTGEKKRAVQTLQRLIAMEPKAVLVGVDFRQAALKAYLRLLRLLRELGFKDALGEYCVRALAEYGHRQEIQNEVGRGFFYLEKPLDALHCFERSLNIVVEQNIDAYIGLCSIYLKAGKKENAEQAVGNIKKFYGLLPKYWAFVEIYNFLNLVGDIPDQISREEIEKEKDIIKREFNL